MNILVRLPIGLSIAKALDRNSVLKWPEILCLIFIFEMVLSLVILRGKSVYVKCQDIMPELSRKRPVHPNLFMLIAIGLQPPNKTFVILESGQWSYPEEGEKFITGILINYWVDDLVCCKCSDFHFPFSYTHKRSNRLVRLKLLKTSYFRIFIVFSIQQKNKSTPDLILLFFTKSPFPKYALSFYTGTMKNLT